MSAVPSDLSILKDLIAINSENPGGSEFEIVEYCCGLLQSFGIPYELEARTQGRPNVIARVEGRTQRKVIYQSHLDTKPALHAGAKPHDWDTDPFTPIEREGLIYGLGACDTKGGVASQLHALITLSRNWKNTFPTLEWQGVVDEENGSRDGCEYLAERGLLGADLAVVAEPTDGLVSTAQLGSVWADISIVGQQAHGGTPWRAKDAIGAALDLIERMKKAVALRPRRSEVRWHPQVGVRILEGGGHAGTVAGNCRVVSDIRVRPDERRTDYIDLWRQVATEVRAEWGVDVVIGEYAGGGCEPNAVADSALLYTLGEAWLASIGTAFEPCVFYGGSDARYFAASGVPSVVFGPGDLQNAHAPNEFVPIEQVERCTRFLTALPRFWK